MRPVEVGVADPVRSCIGAFDRVTGAPICRLPLTVLLPRMEHPPPTIPDHSHRIRPRTIGAATNTRKSENRAIFTACFT